MRDVREVLGPVVEAALAARVVARSEKAFTVSDAIRDGLAGAGFQDERAVGRWRVEQLIALGGGGGAGEGQQAVSAPGSAGVVREGQHLSAHVRADGVEFGMIVKDKGRRIDTGAVGSRHG